MSRPFSLAGRLALLIVANLFACAILIFVAYRVELALDMRPSARTWAMGLALAVPIAIWSARRFAVRLTRPLEAIGDGVRGFRDGDFSLRIAAGGDDEIADLVRLYNEVGDLLRLERNEIYQKELLLDTILQRTPVGVILTNAADRVVYGNAAARELLSGGGRIEGHRFSEITATAAAPLREALAAESDSIFRVSNGEQGDETFHLVRREFHLNTQRYRLLLLERLTPELRRQEVGIWKKAIRMLNHELNNSIAPISSLFHSARVVQERPEHQHRLKEIYDAIEERLLYLRAFLESYAQFARLPEPRKSTVRWSELLDDVRELYPFRLDGNPPGEGTFDRAQLQQVLINLLKNAHESGSAADEVTVSIQRTADGTLLRISDRGRGMDELTMRQALLPFYSTKPGGTGLGLALCNEVIEAHGGRLHLQGRAGGGTVVTCWLPG